MSAPGRFFRRVLGPSEAERRRADELVRLAQANQDAIRELLPRIDRLAVAVERQAEAHAALERRLGSLETHTKKTGAQLVKVQNAVGGKGIRSAVARLDQGMGALLRKLFLDGVELPPPHDLLAERFGLASQNEEDGLTLAVFKRIGTTNRRFVDIGCGGNGGASGFLAQEMGWRGLMVDADDFQHAAAAHWFARPGVDVVKALVTRENVDALLREHGATGEIDLLGIDIDGNDYWVWESLTACSPRLVVVEYNPSFGPTRSVVVPYQGGAAATAHRRYYGASLTALTRLAARKGYRLIATEPTGINAYFLREDVHPSLPACSPETCHRVQYRYFQLPDEDAESIFEVAARRRLPLEEIP